MLKIFGGLAVVVLGAATLLPVGTVSATPQGELPWEVYAFCGNPDDYANVINLYETPGAQGNGQRNIIIGTYGDDTINGGAGNDCIIGRGGNDRIDGGAGNDIIVGGYGYDRINGGSGIDRCDGESESSCEANPVIQDPA